MSLLVKDYMMKDFETIDLGISAIAVSKIMAEKNLGYLIVLEKDCPVGIITERDLVRKVIAGEKDPSKVKVSEVMTTPLVTIDPDGTVDEAIKVMMEHGIQRLPVMRMNVFYGVFTPNGLARHFNEYEEKVAGDVIKHMSLFSRLMARET